MDEAPRIKAVTVSKTAEDKTLFAVTMAIGDKLPVTVIMSREIAAAFASAIVGQLS